MPGIGVRTAARILIDVGDGTAFPTAGHLAAYAAGVAGLCRCKGRTGCPADRAGPTPAAVPATDPATAAATARSTPTTHRSRSKVEYPHPHERPNRHTGYAPPAHFSKIVLRALSARPLSIRAEIDIATLRLSVCAPLPVVVSFLLAGERVARKGAIHEQHDLWIIRNSHGGRESALAASARQSHSGVRHRQAIPRGPVIGYTTVLLRAPEPDSGEQSNLARSLQEVPLAHAGSDLLPAPSLAGQARRRTA